MSTYFGSLGAQLREAGLSGTVLVVTSAGGVLDVERVAAAPIYSIGSGPAMAPVAGKYFAEAELGATTAIVADAGGTSYDVSLVRRGEVPATREAWIGEPYLSDMTGFPAVDVRSIGAGGGSIAWVDEGGLLHVGPQSAGAVPGPVSYSRGGSQPTVTDACLVLGYIDPDFFLGGSMRLDVEAARTSIERNLGLQLELNADEAAAAVLAVTTENMVGAIEDITLKQGIDPRQAILVGGGGAAGLNAVAIARRLGIQTVIIPEVAGVLSAAGGLLSDLVDDYYMSFVTRSDSFAFDSFAKILEALEEKCTAFLNSASLGTNVAIEFSADVRYPSQVSELPVPIRAGRLASANDVEELRQAFHEIHMDYFAVNDPDSPVEIVTWHARARCVLIKPAFHRAVHDLVSLAMPSRPAYFANAGVLDTRVVVIDQMKVDESFDGPLIVESPVTTMVVDPWATARRTEGGSLVIDTKPLEVDDLRDDRTMAKGGPE
jgi:N-methylhydantoinase A